MTKRKKGLIIACASICALAAGAGLGFAPANNFAYADESTAEASYWKEVPHISGWSWGSFDAEKNCFRAIPADYYSGDVTFTFQNSEGQTILTAYEKVLNGEFAYYSDVSFKKLEGEYLNLYLESNLGKWDAGEYTMTAAAEALEGYPAYEASVQFSVQKAKNYWVQTPYIESWYEKSWSAEENLPAAEDAFGNTVEYTVYKAKADANEPDTSAVFYDTVTDMNKLSGAAAGRYYLAARVKGTGNYEELKSIVPFRVFDSQVASTTLEATREAAFDEIDRFIEWDNPFATNLKVDKELAEVQADISHIKDATSVSTIQTWLPKVKLTICKIYAQEEILRYAKDLKVEITLDELLMKPWAEDIQNADDIALVAVKLGSKTEHTGALGEVYKLAVQNARNAASAELDEYAKAAGVTEYDTVFTDANTIEEVEELLAQKKHDIDLKALQTITDLKAYKDRTWDAVRNYAKYIGIYLGNEEDKLRYKDIYAAPTIEDVETIYGELKGMIDEELLYKKLDLLNELRNLAVYYRDEYSVAEEVFEAIISLNYSSGSAWKGIYENSSTFVSAQTAYKIAENDLKAAVLSDVKIAVIEKLKDLAQAGVSPFELDAYVQRVEDAETVDEVEKILREAEFQVDNTLYTARMEVVRALDEFAAEYFEDYNWNVLVKALDEGKDKIYGAKVLSEIYEAFEAAKLYFMRAYVSAELDHYGEIYADYDISLIVDRQKAKVTGSSTTVNALLKLLTDAQKDIYDAAKTTAPQSLKEMSLAYPNFDYSKDVENIKAAENLDGLHKAYTAAKARFNELASAVKNARDMLELYAKSYGLEVKEGTDAAKAIDGIYTAASPEDLPELVKQAKADIDAAAGEVQKRIDSVNAALIACTAVFAAAAVGFATLLVILWRKKKSPAKKSAETETEKKEPDEENQQKPVE